MRSRCCAGSASSRGAPGESACSASRGAASTGFRSRPCARPSSAPSSRSCRRTTGTPTTCTTWAAASSPSTCCPGRRSCTSGTARLRTSGTARTTGARSGFERLRETPPYVEAWLSHQRRDEYWQHGSVCEDFSAIECPVYAIGGWVDGYTDAVLRLLEGLPGDEQGSDRPMGPRLPARRDAGAADRVPPGVRAVVGPLAPGRAERHRRGAPAAGLDAGLGAGERAAGRAAGPVGGRGRVARRREVEARVLALRADGVLGGEPGRGARALDPRQPALRARLGALVPLRRRGRPGDRPADGRRALALVHVGAAGGAVRDPRLSGGAARGGVGSARGSGRASGSATWRRTGPRRSSRAAS